MEVSWTRLNRILICIAAAAAGALPAHAEVVESGAAGFTVHGTVRVAATPQAAWEGLIQPSRYWNGEHSWSGDAANMTLEPMAGRCFCEGLPASGGSVEHARVVYAAPGEMLRLRGSLGPLQAEALTGTLTMTVQPSGAGSKIAWDYVAGGYARMSLKELAPVVDRVVGEQLKRLALLLKSTRGLRRGF